MLRSVAMDGAVEFPAVVPRSLYLVCRAFKACRHFSLGPGPFQGEMACNFA